MTTHENDYLAWLLNNKAKQEKEKMDALLPKNKQGVPVYDDGPVTLAIKVAQAEQVQELEEQLGLEQRTFVPKKVELKDEEEFDKVEALVEKRYGYLDPKRKQKKDEKVTVNCAAPLGGSFGALLAVALTAKKVNK